ncbi:hypothetical protein V6Z11_A06G079900 [Gossypium hirsutum]
MDPCPFVCLIVESLALELLQATKLAGSCIYSTVTLCFCKLRLKKFPSQTTWFPLNNSSGDSPFESSTFALDALTLRPSPTLGLVTLCIDVYTSHMGRTYGVNCRKLMGRIQVTMDLGLSQAKPSVFRDGRTKLGNELDKANAKLHLTVRAKLDSQFLFRFGEETKYSPVLFQIQGNIRKPIFSYKFSANHTKFRNLVFINTISFPLDFTIKKRGWMTTLSGEKRKARKKGWMIMIYDLSSSPVTVASMITPFVPSPSSDRVSQSNLGAWLILNPYGFSVNFWKPLGNLETWRERDKGVLKSSVKGFVKGSTVEGEGKGSKPMVQVGIHHVTYMTDDALFVALSTAIDLSMVASCKLRKELCHDEEDPSS